MDTIKCIAVTTVNHDVESIHRIHSRAQMYEIENNAAANGMITQLHLSEKSFDEAVFDLLAELAGFRAQNAKLATAIGYNESEAL